MFVVLSLLPLAAATEPALGSLGIDPGATVPGVVRLSWSELGFSPAAPEQAAYGPDHLAVGPDGAWALWDAVTLTVVGSGGTFPLPGATDLAFTADGDLLVLDTRRRSLGRYAPDGRQLATTPFPGLVPTSVTLELAGGVAWGVDGLGNAHPIAELAHGLGSTSAAALRRPAHQVVRQGDAVLVDGAVVARAPGLVSGRVIGGADGADGWLLVEVRDGNVVSRAAVSLASGAAVALPGEGRLYRPVDDLAVGPDGRLWWLDPTDAALTLRAVAP